MTLETDYLIKGCGASSMGFIDVLLKATDASITVVDRGAAPGGHWNFTYPFVRLHQPSDAYGIASRDFGDDALDVDGTNAGMRRLPTGLQVADHYHRAMAEIYLPSGRVTWFPMSELTDDGDIVSLVSGRRRSVRIHRKLVDGTHLETLIPLVHRRGFDVAADVDCVPPNDLPRFARGHDRFVVIGGGKTGLDAVSWLLDHGAAPEAVGWVIPRDAWWIDRRSVQTAPALRAGTLKIMRAQTEAMASARSTDDLALGMEAAGGWLRLDPAIRPAMFHAGTTTRAEVNRVRGLGRLVREGRVLRLEPDRMVLEGGVVPTGGSTLFVDCSARALAHNCHDRTPVFRPGRIDLQLIRFPLVCFSTALIALIEARVDDEKTRARMTGITPMTDTVADWIDRVIVNMENQAAWLADARVSDWIRQCRLEPMGRMMRTLPEDDVAACADRDRVRALSESVLENLRHLRG
jgi:hypothetical protein